MGKRTIYGPTDTQNFICIASKCEETCCSNWNIDIDKKTYIKYKNMKDEWFKELFSTTFIKHFILIRKENLYGKIILTNKRECPILNEDKLCRLHAQHGSDALSLVCNHFPKTTNQIDDKFERSLTLACPEAARVVLLKKEDSQYAEYEEDVAVRICINRTLNTKKNSILNKHIKYLHEIRSFQGEIMLKKNYSISQRLTLLADFYKNFEDYINKGGEIKVADFISHYNESMNLDKIKIITGVSQSHRRDIMALVKKIFQSLNDYTNILPKYEECYKQARTGLGLESGNGIADINSEEFLKHYEELYEKYLQPFIIENDYFLENYVQNVIFRDVVPFQIFSTVFNAFSVFSVFYSLLIFHLVGIAAYNNGLTFDLAVKMIYTFSKTYNHNEKLNKIIYLNLRMKKMDTLGHISGLINCENRK